MTMLENFLEIHPNAPMDIFTKMPKVCPCDLGWGNLSECSKCTCYDCWNREYREEFDKKK